MLGLHLVWLSAVTTTQYFGGASLALLASIVLWMIAITYHFHKSAHPGGDAEAPWIFAAFATAMFVASIVLSFFWLKSLHPTGGVFGHG